VDKIPWVVGVVRGDRLIARYGDVVLFVDDDGQSAGELLAGIEPAAHTPHPGAAIAERVAGWTVGGASARVPAFGVVAPMPEGLLVIVRGGVKAAIESADGIRMLSGERAYTWVDEVLPETVTQVGVTAAAGPVAQASTHTDLRAGVVPAGGFVLQRAGAAAPKEASRERAAKQQPPGETTPGRRGQPERGVPTQLWQPGAPRAAADPATVDSTDSPLLVAEDGAVFPLDRPYVLGRDPAADEAVRDAAASPIVVKHDQHVSRVHAYISIDGDKVQVRDAQTPGGTFVAAPGAKEWTPVGKAPTELPAGWRLRIGERIFTRRSADRS
jgi:hypothetical protein